MEEGVEVVEEGAEGVEGTEDMEKGMEVVEDIEEDVGDMEKGVEPMEDIEEGAGDMEKGVKAVEAVVAQEVGVKVAILKRKPTFVLYAVACMNILLKRTGFSAQCARSGPTRLAQVMKKARTCIYAICAVNDSI